MLVVVLGGGVVGVTTAYQLQKQVQAQASFPAYGDVFWILMLVALMTVPLALTLRKVKLGGAAPMVH